MRSICVYPYNGIANPDETSFAMSIALQAYFEGRKITKADMDKCLEYWRENIAEHTNLEERRRKVCMENACRFPMPSCKWCYQLVRPKRNNPYGADGKKDDDHYVTSEELQEVYDTYNQECQQQIQRYNDYLHPVKYAHLCSACGCRRCFGRKGFFFCTEGCDKKSKQYEFKEGDPAPPFIDRDIDDENDASMILFKVLGDPPANVRIKRWIWDEDQQKHVLFQFPRPEANDQNNVEEGVKGEAVDKYEPEKLVDDEGAEEEEEEDKLLMSTSSVLSC